MQFYFNTIRIPAHLDKAPATNRTNNGIRTDTDAVFRYIQEQNKGSLYLFQQTFQRLRGFLFITREMPAVKYSGKIYIIWPLVLSLHSEKQSICI